MSRAAVRAGAAGVVILLTACVSGPLPLQSPAAAPAVSEMPLASPLAVPQPPLGSGSELGEHVVDVAESVLGAPYRYGGAASTGFDCSGLVFFAYAKLGVAVPRTVAAQSAAATRVPDGELAPGDLVFFRVRGRHIDHVGIYAGRGRFIHAPARGKTVAFASLADPFYARHYVGAGRFTASAASR